MNYTLSDSISVDNVTRTIKLRSHDSEVGVTIKLTNCEPTNYVIPPKTDVKVIGPDDDVLFEGIVRITWKAPLITVIRALTLTARFKAQRFLNLGEMLFQLDEINTWLSISYEDLIHEHHLCPLYNGTSSVEVDGWRYSMVRFIPHGYSQVKTVVTAEKGIFPGPVLERVWSETWNDFDSLPESTCQNYMENIINSIIQAG